MFTFFIRGIVLYGVMILMMRALGKRQLGQFQPYEFAMTIFVANVISAPIEDVSIPLLHGLLPVAAMFVVHCTITLLSLRSDKLRAFFSGKPAVVISKGVIDQSELDRLCLSLSELLEGLRQQGILHPVEVGTAVIEANGNISAFPSGHARAPQTQELNIDPGYEGLPLILIMDGRIQKNNLTQSGQNEKWLNSFLGKRGLTVKGIYLASLDTQGKLMLQLKNGGIMLFDAIDPAKVVW